MKLLIALYLLLTVSVWYAVNTFREKSERKKGLFNYIIIAVIWFALTGIGIYLFGFDLITFICHLVFSIAGILGGIGLSFLQLRRKTITKNNEYDGKTYLEDFKFRDGTRNRKIFHLDNLGSRKKVEHYNYFNKNWILDFIDFYHRDGYLIAENYDEDGRMVLREEVRISDSRRISMEYPLGKEAAQKILDRRLTYFKTIISDKDNNNLINNP